MASAGIPGMMKPSEAIARSKTRNVSGVEVSPELKTAFHKLERDSSSAFLKVLVKDEALVPGDTVARGGGGGGGWRLSDLDTLRATLTDKEPCFAVAVRRGKPNLLVTYVPEGALVSQKMLFSSSKASLRVLIGAKSEEIFASSPSEVSSASYKANASIEGPKSYVEKELDRLPKALKKSDMDRSAGFSLLAQVSGKKKPAVLSRPGGGRVGGGGYGGARSFGAARSGGGGSKDGDDSNNGESSGPPSVAALKARFQQ